MDREFSPRDPRASMKVVTKIERVQPIMAGVDEHGEIIWEGHEMPRWQQELFRKVYCVSKEEFGHLWDQVARKQNNEEEFLTDECHEPYWAIATPEQIKNWKKWASLVREYKRTKQIKS